MLTPSLTEPQRRVFDMLAAQLPFYSEKCLKILDKRTNLLVPFVFNRAQRYLHERLEKQYKERGLIRAVILKGRKLGCTTYVQARFWHKTNFNKYLSAYVLSHQAESTLKIFEIAQRFRDNLPAPFKIPLDKDTEKAMVMATGSSYTVGTAGSSEIGRGLTVRLLHGSEVAFFENADQISTGLMQAVADVPGTEIIFESTANGPGGFFYNLVMNAIAKKNGFDFIFLPWYWDEDCADPVPLKESELTEQECKFMELYA